CLSFSLQPSLFTVFGGKGTVFAGKTTVFAGKTTVFAEKTTVFAEKTTVFVEKTTVFTGKTTVFGEKTTVFREQILNTKKQQDSFLLSPPQPEGRLFSRFRPERENASRGMAGCSHTVHYRLDVRCLYLPLFSAWPFVPFRPVYFASPGTSIRAFRDEKSIAYNNP
ncbi:MAG: hypothetical protein LBP50_01330, partial [Tannerella sp.]|nr:hypothetical protein [Tannerella sp.]